MRRQQARALGSLMGGLVLAAACGWWRAADAAAEGNPDVGVLSGRLFGESLTLAADSTYRLRGTFTVPAGAELRIEAGVKIIAESRSELVVEGKLVAKGTADKRIVIAMSEIGQPRWRGIVLRGSKGSSLALVEVRDSREAVVLEGASEAELVDCRIWRTLTGLRIAGGSACVVKNSQIEPNESGIVLSASRLEASNCTITGGPGVAVNADGATATVERSVVTMREGTGFRISGASALAVHQCRIVAGGRTVVVDTTAEQDFTHNFWGIETRTLRKSGAAANLGTIIDGLDQPARGRAVVVPFLIQWPEPCGADLQNPISDPAAQGPATWQAELFEANARVVFKQDCYVVIDERLRTALDEARAPSSAWALKQLIRSGAVIGVTRDTLATVTEHTDWGYRVLILDGVHKGKKGLAQGHDLAESIGLAEADLVGKSFVWSEDKQRPGAKDRRRSAITLLEGGKTNEAFSPPRTWKLTPDGCLVLMSPRRTAEPEVTDRFTRARREDGLLVLQGPSAYAYGGTATLRESPDASDVRGAD